MPRQFLTIAPIVLVAICYAVAGPGPSMLPTRWSLLSSAIRTQMAEDSVALEDACQAVAGDLRKQLPDGWCVVVESPFVLGGDCDEPRLRQSYRQTLQPTSQALSVQYFDNAPRWPITVLLCSSDDAYRECHRRLDDQDRNEYSGIYLRNEHRVVVNVSTGDGTLAHELTHALAHADFPKMPEWLDEGLASLHEECEFSADGMRLLGLDNWRRNEIMSASRQNSLRSVNDLASERFAISDRASTDYAHARYFCLFLQQRHLLEAFYRKCRSRERIDPTGVDSLCEIFQAKDCHTVDQQFLSWFNKLTKVAAKDAARR